MTARPLTDEDFARLLAFRVELRRFLRHSEQAASDAGITPAVHQLLLAVRGLRAQGDPTVGEVAGLLDVRHHSAVELAQRAERHGLLDRRGDPHDHRQVRLRLTAEGEATLDALTRVHLPAIAALAGRLAEVVDET